jgi:exosortase/archaeosortase family protein
MLSRDRPPSDELLRGAWPAVAATIATAVLYFGAVAELLSKAGEMLGGVFDTSVPFYPQVGLFFVFVFLLLRRRELYQRLGSQPSAIGLRAAGLLVAVAPAVALFAVTGGITTSNFVVSGVAVALGWFGFLAAIRPATMKFLLPYLIIYVVAVVSVNAVQTLIGDPLAGAVAAISSAGTYFAGLPVSWHATYFTFTTLGGVPMSLYISDACSGIASVSIFLLLLALMHVDLGAKVSTTLEVAVAGTLALVFLNALRVILVIWGGYVYGPDMLWNLHGWLGYAIYIGFFAAIAVIYTRMQPASGPGPVASTLHPSEVL